MVTGKVVQNELTRSSSDCVFTGICGGLAEKMSVESWIVRVGFALGVFLGFISVFVYIILAFCLAKKEELEASYKPKILGVCLRLAKKYDWEVGVVRSTFLICLILSIVPSFGTTLIVYFLIHFFLPESEETKLSQEDFVVDVEAKDISDNSELD